MKALLEIISNGLSTLKREENSSIIKMIYEEVVQWDDCE